MNVVDLEISTIDITESYQIRATSSIEKGSLRLANSVNEVELLHPVIVQEKEDGRYDLVAGHVRLETLKKQGKTQVPASVIQVDDNKALQSALVENLVRVNMTSLEKARALNRLVEQFGMTHEKIAKLLGVSRPQVSNWLRLFKLETEVQEAILAGEIEFGHAKALLVLKHDRNLQLRALARIKRMKTASTREVEQLVRRMKAEDEGLAPLADFQLPEGVALQERAKKRRLVVDFTTPEELADALTQMLELNSNRFHVEPVGEADSEDSDPIEFASEEAVGMNA